MTTVSLGGSAPASFGRFRNAIEVFDIIPGTRQLTIPNGWSRIRVAVVGGGAGGRNATSSTRGYGGGGGGGGYAELELDVVPGQTYTYTVGAGGDANQDGGTTSFGALLSATGGKTATDTTSAASKGGAGGTGIGGSINKSGGAGGNGFDANNGGGGGGGASGNRYGAGGAGGNGEAYINSTVMGGVGGSWDGYPRPLLYDDGWGLGITPHDLPLIPVSVKEPPIQHTRQTLAAARALIVVAQPQCNVGALVQVAVVVTTPIPAEGAKGP